MSRFVPLRVVRMNSVESRRCKGGGSFKRAGSSLQNVILCAFREFQPRASTILSSLFVFLNVGGGRFAAQPSVTVGDNPYFVVAGDFDGDGRPDLAVANNFGSSVSILLSTCTP
jgi:hypothetical protein